MAPKISCVIICFNRKNEVKECVESILQQTYSPVEIIVIDNNSTDGTDELFKTQLVHPTIKYIKLDSNLGVAGGRNFGIRQSIGDILVFIDDDAFLEPKDALEKIVTRFETDSSLGILAFKIINYHTKKIVREEFPHIEKSINPNHEFETTYFIGAGHAIRKSIFTEVGLYTEDFFYGMEELDLSFRVIDKGYKIYYYPEVIVWHKKSLKGRMSENKKWIFTYRNRLIISYKYLGYHHILISSLIWFFKILLVSRSVIVPVQGLLSFFIYKYKKKVNRQPISVCALDVISNLKGRLWY